MTHMSESVAAERERDFESCRVWGTAFDKA